MIVETANEGIWIKNADHLTTFVNQKMAQMLGFSILEMLGKPFHEFVFEEDLEEMHRRHRERLSGITSGYDLRLKKKDGSFIWTHINASPLLENGAYFGSLGMVTDITSYKEKEKEREENERRYRSLFEDSPVPTWDEDFSQVKKYLDDLGKKGITDIREYFENNPEKIEECSNLMIVNDINQAVVKLNEAPDREYMLANFRKLINKRSAEYAIRQFVAIANGDDTCEFDAELNTFSNRKIHIHFKWKVVEGFEDTYERVYLTTSDVTERILAENDRLRSSNLQKELLLKEIHHRVKNNLQIITSLLRLQSNTIDDERITELMDTSLNRINSMALVHDLLYRSHDLSKIAFEEYMEKLLKSILDSFEAPGRNINIDVQVDGFEFNISTSILLGLLINELVTNSLKHGFSEQNNGEIYLRIEKVADNGYRLDYGDNGKGFEMIDDVDKIDSLGLSLIHNLVDQLNGMLEKLNDKTGTHFNIEFQELNLRSDISSN